MADYTKLPGSPAKPRNGNTARGSIAINNTSSFDLGQPVTTNSIGEILFAQANAANTANVLGLIIGPGEGSGNPIEYQYNGPLTLTTEQWDNVTGGSGGLTAGDVYWLSPATAGKITTTKPISGGNYQAPIGYATSPTTMMILLGVAAGPFS